MFNSLTANAILLNLSNEGKVWGHIHNSTKQNLERILKRTGVKQDTNSTGLDSFLQKNGTSRKTLLVLLIGGTIFLPALYLGVVNWVESRAYSELKKGYNKNAIDLYDIALNLKPWSADLYFARAASRHSLIGTDKEKREKTVEDYSEAIKRNPDLSAALYWRGMIALAANESESGIVDITAAIRIDKNWKDDFVFDNSFFGKSTAFLQRCIVYGNRNLVQKAIEDCTDAIQIKKDYANAYNQRGLLYEKQADLSKALNDYTASIENKILEIWIPYSNRAFLKSQQEEYDEALKDFNKSIAANQKFSTAWYGRGLVYSKMKQPDKAIKDFNQALLLGSSAMFFKERGRVYTGLENHKRAIEDYSQAILLDQNDPETHYLRCGANVGSVANLWKTSNN
jgi:tetratricopeptide (TPR) repeat protein